MSESKKRKNANYTAESRQQAAPVKPVKNAKKKPASVKKQNKPIKTPKEPGAIMRFLTRKPSILDQNPNKKHPLNYCLLGFLIPFLGTLFVMAIRAFAMEHNTSAVFSLLYSDAYYQYYPFLIDLRRSILSGDGLLYNWSVGMGVDYLGLYSYYLGSPLNWLSLLIPESWVLDFYTFLVPVRMGLAGLFFSIFLKKLFKRNDISIALFGSFYATCAWACGYMWNVMWLDTFALLPLVVLGTISLLNDRKFVLYTVSLCLSVAINYYIGFFTCIFTLLVFICYEICRWKGFKKFAIDLSLMAVFTIIGIGMTAVISLPAYAALQTTHSSDNTFPTEFQMHIAEENTVAEFFKAYVKVATNVFASVEPNDKSAASKGGLPNIYCGLFAAAFAVLFFTCKQVKWRDRIVAALMLVFFNLSFIFKQLDYIGHGFHFTNEIPNRFAFVYSFVLLYMAYRVWLLRRRIKPWQILVTMAVLITGMFFSAGYTAFLETTKETSLWQAIASAFSNGLSLSSFASLNQSITPESLFIYVNGGLMLLYFGFLLLISIRIRPKKGASWSEKRRWHLNRKTCRAIGTLGLVAAISLELAFNIISFGMTVNVQNLRGYPRGGEDTKKIIQYAKDREGENSFYRMEVAQHQTYNDGALNGFNGITTFASSANVRVTNFLRAIGLSGYKSYNRIAYYDTSPINHMFLNLKYVLERQNYVEENPYLTDVQSSGKVHLMENNYYLPLGFMVDPEMPEMFYTAGSLDMEKVSSAKKAASSESWTPMYPTGKPDAAEWPEWKADTATHFATVANVGYEDAGALHMKTEKGKNVAVAINAGLKPGKTYTLTLWAKGSSDAPVALALYGNGDGAIVKGDALKVGWAEYTLTFTAASKSFSLYAPGQGTTDLFVDNISLIGEDGRNLLTDTGGFYSADVNTIGNISTQNELLSAALGEEVAPFTELSDENAKMTLNEYVTIDRQTGDNYYYTTTSNKGRIFFNFTADREGLMCIYLDMAGKNKYTVSYKAAGEADFEKVHEDTHNGLSYISAIRQVYPGDEIQVTMECKDEKSKRLNLTAAILDQAMMDQAYAKLSESTLNVTKFENTLIEGTIDCKQSGLMYTSIPQSGKNWHVYVDGEEADITLIGDVMIGVMLDEGTHTVTFRYQNDAFTIGLITSVVCLLCLLALTWFVYIYLKKNPGKFAKKETND